MANNCLDILQDIKNTYMGYCDPPEKSRINSRFNCNHDNIDTCYESMIKKRSSFNFHIAHNNFSKKYRVQLLCKYAEYLYNKN